MQKHQRYGFTLIELAIVMVIIGLISGGGIHLTRALSQRQQRQETTRYLEDAKQSLKAYAGIQGALPWADSDGDGEGDSGTLEGWLPYQDLGITPADSYRNPIKYAVNTSVTLDKSTTCTALSSGLISVPELVEADGSGESFSVSALMVSSGPSDADRNGNRFDELSGTYTGDNADGRPNYIRSPLSDGFDDLLRYVSSSDLFEMAGCAQLLSVWELTVENTSANELFIYDTTQGTCLGRLDSGAQITLHILRGNSVELRDSLVYLTGNHVDSSPNGPFSVTEHTFITVP